MKSAEGRTPCCACSPAPASPAAVYEGPEEEDYALLPVFHLKKGMAPVCPLVHKGATLVEATDGTPFPK